MKFARLLTRLLMALMFMGLTSPINATCFKPLSDPKSNNTEDWSILIDHKGDKADDADIDFIQDLSNNEYAIGNKINLDFYSVTFNRHPTKSIAEFFLEIRKNLGTIIFKPSDVGEFRDYPYYARGLAGNSGNVPVGLDRSRVAVNQKKWNSNNPKGALMNFVLSTPAISFDPKKDLLTVVHEEGDVLVTCASDTDFIFSTVHTKNNRWHPVSGNRGFGVSDNGNGTWSFYVMAADRKSAYLPIKLGLGPDVFAEGHKVWVGMLDNFKRKYFSLTPRDIVSDNHEKYDFPIN